ncbi:leucine-rich repeat-containing protein 31-like [Porites lutea]|uniref:leucine-rich repeat-containing protein 31-like n=1 Tax=Porites lutea TaxID=51062 RepID=UPI003CC63FF0
MKRLKISGSDGCKLHLKFPLFRELKIRGVTEFSAEVVTRWTVGVIKGKPFEKLELSKINLTSAVAEALGQLLPELSALQTLEINRLTEWSDGGGAKFFAALKHKTLKELDLSGINVKPTATEALGQSLPELSALKTLKISGLTECSDEAVTKLVSAIKHKTLKDLELSKINLTSAVAVALVQSLSELPSLQDLTVDGLDGCNLHLRLSVLPELEISGLTEFPAEAVTRLIDIIKNKPFVKLELSEINLTSAVAEALGQLLPELSALQTLEINGLTEWSDGAGTIFFAAFKHKTLKELDLSEISVMSAATEALGQSLPELSALRSLKISGLDKCMLQQKEVEALFGSFNRPSSIKELWFTGFTARGSLAPLVKNLCLFPCLKVLKLEDLDMGEDDLSDLLENLKFTPDLESLHLSGNPLGHVVRSMTPCLLEQQKLQMVYFGPEDCSEEDLRYVQEAVEEKRPRLRIETWFWQDE